MDRGLQQGETFLMRAVVILRERVTRRATGLDVSVDDRVVLGIARHARAQRTVAATVGIRTALPGLLLAKIRQHMGIGPLRETGRRPPIIVAAMTANVSHG